MGIHDLYSKRNKGQSDVYTYDIPKKLRIQVKFIIEDFLTKNDISYSNRYWRFVYEVLTREHGKQSLYDSSFGHSTSEEYQVLNYLLYEEDIEQVLDTIEFSFRCITRYDIFMKGTSDSISVYRKENAINDLNTRFRENAIGYRFESGVIIKADNEILHKEITKPTLLYLSNKKYKTINDEYLKAHEHYRHGNLKECINECLKAFETTLKIICNTKSWTYDQTDTSRKLIKIIFDNNLVPEYLQSQFSGLRSTLESGIPTIRNKNSGHGQGPKEIVVSETLASYTLNLTGSTIKYLVELLEE